MDSEKIIQDLNRRFAAPLPEFYKRRIVVWIDEDAEFADKLDEITLSGAKVVALTGSNNFYVKKLLAVDDPTGNYLVYRPFAYESDEDNWLLDMELYGEEFRADLVSMWMDEMGIPQTPALRRGFKQYRKFFNAQARRNKVSSQAATPTTPAQLQMAIMAALAGLKDAKPNAIIKTVLQAGLLKDSNPVYAEFVNYGIDEAFWRMVAQGTGYQDMDTDLAQLATHLLLTASTRTMRQEFLAGLQMFISSAHQAYCYDFVSDWMHSEDAKDIYEIAAYVEDELKLPQRFMKLQVADLVDTEVFPCVNEVILVKLMTEISDHIIDVDTITQTVEKRRTCVWYDGMKNYYEGILQVAKMQAFFKEHSAGFHTVEPAKVWKEYTTEYYIMDTYYREFHKSYSESLKNYHEELSDLFTHVIEKVEGLYVTWFLGQLGNNWSDACADNLREYGRVLEVPQQTDFYRRQVAASDSKVYVIISDAMRYEVAASLAEQLQRETQAKVDLKSMQGIFPTITKFGMAALLPNKALSVELKSGKTERLAVLADGQSTEAPNRDKLLKAADSASVALKYKDIIGMKRADRQALIKGMNVVYIYHDTIDEAGHLESSIFTACDTAIEELKNMVLIIANEWGGANIIITSDHGFLYTHSPLTEDDKVDKTTESDQDVEIGRRYAIMQKGAQPQYLLPVKFLGGDTAYDAFAPRESIRIKMKGGGLNFVHGGISLQEMVVPVIEYHFLRNLFSFTDAILDIKGYSGAGEFARNFPFVPYQFILMQKVFAEIRKHGNSGKHLSGGERSMLSGFQEAAQKIEGKDEYALAPFYLFYDTVHTFLDSSIRRVIERCERAAIDGNGIEPQDVDVLKLLYLVRYVDDVKANLDNIVILMADDIRLDKITMREQVRGSLDRLMSQNYIGRTGDTYNFLTDEEQDIP